MKNIKSKIVFFVLSSLTILSLTPAVALADTKSDIQCGVNNAAGAACGAKPTGPQDLNTTIHNFINILSVIIGVVAVIMIIIAGFRYVTSGGAAEKVSGAKNTLTYAIIGLIIVALAQVIARFVLTQATTSG